MRSNMLGEILYVVFILFIAYMAARFLFAPKVLAHFQRIVDARRGK